MKICDFCSNKVWMMQADGERRWKSKVVKAEREGRALLGNGDEMLMCLLVMHCSKLREAKEKKEGRKAIKDIRRQTDSSKWSEN